MGRVRRDRQVVAFRSETATVIRRRREREDRRKTKKIIYYREREIEIEIVRERERGGGEGKSEKGNELQISTYDRNYRFAAKRRTTKKRAKIRANAREISGRAEHTAGET